MRIYFDCANLTNNNFDKFAVDSNARFLNTIYTWKLAVESEYDEQ